MSAGPALAWLPPGHVSQLPGRCWALQVGNVTAGCGVMVTTGTLNDRPRSLNTRVAVASQLITVAAVALALGAPLPGAVRLVLGAVGVLGCLACQSAQQARLAPAAAPLHG